jgi:hypothetical protein
MFATSPGALKVSECLTDQRRTVLFRCEAAMIYRHLIAVGG